MKISKLIISCLSVSLLCSCGGHTHTFASEWTYDENNHWHRATCEHTDQKDGVAAHTIGADGKCTVCDYQQQPSYTKMSEEQFNALVNKIQTQGIAAQFDLLAKAGDVVLAKEKASFKFDIASTSYEELNYNDTGAVVNGSILKDLTEYGFNSSGWSVIRHTLTEQEAKRALGEELEGMAEQFFPSQTYADYNFDETNGKYTVDLTNEQQLHLIFVYTMDANGITKIEGTTSGEYEGVNVVSTVNTSSVNVGPQTIVKPDVPEKDPNEVSEQEWVDAFGTNNLDTNPFYLANNFKLTAKNTFDGQTETAYMIADGNKLKNDADNRVYYWEVVEGIKYQYSQDEETKKWKKEETSITGAEDYAFMLEAFADHYSSFSYDRTSKTYKCASLDSDGGVLENIEIKFENKKIVNISSDTTFEVAPQVEVSYHLVLEIVYGGQSVTLPDVPESGLVEVDFNTFKNKALNLPASPYDLVSTHYRALGNQGSYPIDIDKTVTLTKKNSAWQIDVAPTHVDYACASQCKQMLDTVTLASLVAAGEPTDGTVAKFFYDEELGFKVVSNYSHTGEGSVVTSYSIMEWNEYGDLTKNDVHSVDANVNVEVAADIHVIGDFTYSKSEKPDPKPIGDDAVETQAIKHGLDTLMEEEKLTTKITMTEEMTGAPAGLPNVESAVLDGDEAYLLMDSKYGKQYESVTKKEDKHLYARFSSMSEYSDFYYVDENHAKDLVKHKYFDNGLLESINYLAECQSFAAFGDFIILKAGSGEEFTPITKNDYKVEVEKKVLDSNDRYVSITIIMNEDWVSKQTMSGMQLSRFELGCSFTYNDNFLVSYANTQLMAVSVAGQEMAMSADVLCTFDNKVDETVKTAVLTEQGKKELPDIISNGSTTLSFKVDGYEIYGSYLDDYTNNTAGALIINGVVNDPQSDLNKLLAPLGSSVTVKYFYNGKEVPNYSNIVLSSYENVFNIVVSATDENKCAVAYAYRTVTHLSHGTTSDEVYNIVVVDKTNSYTIQTSFGGVDYSDKYGTIDFVLSEPKYDISNLNSILFICVKDIPYVPEPFVEESFTLDSISNYQEIKDKEISEGYTVGDYLDGFINSTLYFVDDQQCELTLDSGDFFSGNYSKQDTGYVAYFYGPDSFSWGFVFDSVTDTINVDFEINLMDFTTVTAHLVYTII